jgi:hypothetical protein
VAVYEKIAKFYPEKSLTEIKAAVSSELDRMEMEAAKLPAGPEDRVVERIVNQTLDAVEARQRTLH